MSVGCALDETDVTTSEDTAELITTCTVFRPMSWGTAGNLCVERKGPTVYLQVGEEFETIAVPGWNRGEGYLVLGCSSTNGLYIVDSYCHQE
jgi:hypothetical protein